MPLMVGGFRLTWKVPVEGIGGAAEVGVGLPPLEGGTTISAKMGAEETVGELNVEAHAVECGGGE